MSGFDVLWTDLQGAVTNISGFLNSIMSAVGGIANTGQGIFSGLATYGSSIWQGLQAIATSIENAFTYVSDTLGTWFHSAWVYLSDAFGNAISSIGTNLYNFGQWVWSGMAYIGQVIINALAAFGKWVVDVIGSFWTFLTGAFSSIPNTVNGYFTNVVGSWRSKVKTVLMADMALNFGWDGIQNAVTGLHKVNSVEEFGMSIFGMLLAPVAGAFGGYFLGTILDSLLPHTNLNVQILPQFNINAPNIPAMNITTPAPYNTPTSTGAIISLTGLVQPSTESVSATTTSEEVIESSLEAILRSDNISEGVGEVSVEGLNASSP